MWISDRWRTLKGFAVALAAVVGGVSAGTAVAAPLDFDADGRSDLTRVEVGADKKLTWKAALSQSGETRTLGVLGSEGDHLIPGQWFAGSTSLGVVSVDGSSGGLVWTVLSPQATQVQRTFGQKGDLAVAGADFNGNGTADAAVVRYVGSQVQWTVRYDMFAQETPNEVTFNFGKPGDRVFFARVEAGVDAAGVMRRGSGKSSMALMRNLVTSQVQKLVRLPGFASTGARPRAFPIRQSSGVDLLGFQVQRRAQTELRAFTVTGQEVASVPFDGTGIALVGDFLTVAGDEGYEIAFQGSKESGVFNPARGVAQSAAFLGGIAVDEVNINVVGEEAPSDGGQDTGSGGGSSGPVVGCSQKLAWPSGHIYKTIGSTHFTDVRRNTIGVVLKVGARGPYPQCVEALDSKGRVLAKLGLYSRGAGWAARYYAGVGCGSGTPFNGSRVASLAREGTGSSSIFMNFGGVCYGPIDATKCIGSSQC